MQPTAKLRVTYPLPSACRSRRENVKQEPQSRVLVLEDSSPSVALPLGRLCPHQPTPLPHLLTITR